MRYEPGITSPNIVGGSRYNSIGNGLSGASILSGGSMGGPNVIDSGADYSVIAGGHFNEIEGPYSAIAGGDSNAILAINADHNFIGGGLGNIEMNPSFGVIAGGWDNYLGFSAWSSSILGGELDSVLAPLSVIAGGQRNTVAQHWDWGAFIGGGMKNHIENGYAAFIGAGDSNYLSGNRSILGAGQYNNLWGDFAFLGAGYKDTMRSQYGVMGGGYKNMIDWGSDYAALVGGSFDYIGGANYSFLGAGLHDSLYSRYSVLVGGYDNVIAPNAHYSVVGGGERNYDESQWATIVGGYGNVISDSSDYSFIGGGQYNHIHAPGRSQPGANNFIGAGTKNYIDGLGLDHGRDPASNSAIAAGTNDSIHEAISFIGAGQYNRTYDDGDFVGAGSWNVIDSSSESAIAAGRGNTINIPIATYGGIGSAFIGAGDSNVINGNGALASIPSGDHLIANEYTQAVVGHYNITPSGSVHDPNSATTHGDDFLFIAGNGTSTVRSNAFEVSYNGHSTVFQTNGTGIKPLGNPVVYGSTYQDNTIIAWGDIEGSTTAGLTTFTIHGDLGVASVAQKPGLLPDSRGCYVVTISLKNPHETVDSVSLSQASITATIVNISTNPICHIVNVSPFGAAGLLPNQFMIIIGDAKDATCGRVDDRVMFKVCGRK